MTNTFRCSKCGSVQDLEGIAELKEWHEEFLFDKKTQHYICTDCWDNLSRKSADEQLEELINGVGVKCLTN